MEFLQNASAVLDSIDLTLIYSCFVGIGIICCFFIYLFGGDDGGVGDGDLSGMAFSPTGLAFFTTGLGAYGLIFVHGFKVSALLSLVLSLILSVITMCVLNYIFFKVFVGSGSVVQQEDIVGVVGSVYTAIPEDGMGEIVYRDSRGRQKSPARSSDNKAIAAGTKVMVRSDDGAVLVVEPCDSRKNKNKASVGQETARL